MTASTLDSPTFSTSSPNVFSSLQLPPSTTQAPVEAQRPASGLVPVPSLLNPEIRHTQKELDRRPSPPAYVPRSPIMQSGDEPEVKEEVMEDVL